MGTKVRVLQVFASLNMGGAESRMMDVYRRIDKEEYTFDFISLSNNEMYFEEEIRALGGKIFKCNAPPKKIVKHFFELRSIMKSNGPFDAVHAHTSYHCGLVVLAAFTCRIPVRIAHSRTVSSSKTSLSYILECFIGKRLISLFANYRIAISENAASFLFGKNWQRKRNTCVIKNAIDIREYCKEYTRKGIIEEFGLDINEQDIVIGHIGRFSPIKNHLFLVDLFSCYAKLHSSKLVLIGQGPTQEKVIKHIDELGLSSSVIIPGLRSDVYKWMKVFDVVVMPSIFEGLCNVVIEAQLSGVPCVLSDGIPKKETDLGLGMTEYTSLNESFDVWINAIERARNKTQISFENRLDAFNRNGYNLDRVIEQYKKIYCNKCDSI